MGGEIRGRRGPGGHELVFIHSEFHKRPIRSLTALQKIRHHNLSHIYLHVLLRASQNYDRSMLRLPPTIQGQADKRKTLAQVQVGHWLALET